VGAWAAIPPPATNFQGAYLSRLTVPRRFEARNFPRVWQVGIAGFRGAATDRLVDALYGPTRTEIKLVEENTRK